MAFKYKLQRRTTAPAPAEKPVPHLSHSHRAQRVSLDGNSLERQRFTNARTEPLSSGIRPSQVPQVSNSQDVHRTTESTKPAVPDSHVTRAESEYGIEDLDDLPNRGFHNQALQRAKQLAFSRGRNSEPFTVANQLRRTIFNSWLNLLLLLAPTGIAIHAVRGDSIETFVVNLVATFPLQFLADRGLEEIQLRLGKTFASLLYISTCNFVQLISCILLLLKKENAVLQTTLIGGILANILLILGASFIAGGLRRQEQHFNVTTAQVSSNLLSLSGTSLLIPTAAKLLGQTSQDSLAKQSRGASVVLLVVYFLYMVFSLKTHRGVFSQKSTKVPAKPWSEPKAVRGMLALPGAVMGYGFTQAAETERVKWALVDVAKQDDDDDDEEQEPKLFFPVALFLYLASTVFLFFLVDNVVNSISTLADTAHLSKTFIGLVLLPIPNCDLGAIQCAIKDDVDLVIAYTIGKCLQTALFIMPFIVLLAWWLGISGVTLVFDGFEIVSLFASILLLNLIVSPGKDTWIQGALLLADWGLIAIAAYFVDL